MVAAEADAAVLPAVLQAQDVALLAARRLSPPAWTQALRLAVVELPPLRLSPHGFWSSRLTAQRPCLRRLLPLLPQRRRPAELPRRLAAGVAAERAVAER